MNKCKWEKLSDGQEKTCHGVFLSINDIDYKYCPYCGKEIEYNKFDVKKMYGELFEYKSYFNFNDIGEVLPIVGSFPSELILNCLTKNQAKQIIARNILQNYSTWKNGGKFYDFKPNQENWYIDYDYQSDNLYWNVAAWHKTSSVYFQESNQAIKDLGEKLIKEALGIFEEDKQ